MIDFFDLTYAQVRDMSPVTAEKVLLSILAERATVSGGGQILRWSEYNENPDPLINRLLAKLLISKMDPSWFENLTYREIVVFSIESSAAYLAVELSFEVMRAFAFQRPLRIIRARKSERAQHLSPAMNTDRHSVEVEPITAGGDTRHLTASFPHHRDFANVKLVIVADDFKATGSTLMGGVRLAHTLVHPERIIPVAAMSKSWQSNTAFPSSEQVEEPLVALDVKYWWDSKTNNGMISANNLPAQIMTQVAKSDFAAT